MGRFELPEEIRYAACQLMKEWPPNRDAARVVVEFLDQAIVDARYWGPPEEVWRLVEDMWDWLAAK
jgi:hypothetical protein